MFLYSPPETLTILVNRLKEWPINPDKDIMDIEIHITGWDWRYVYKLPESQWELQSGLVYITKQDWLWAKEN